MGDEATLGVLDVLTHPLPHLLYMIGSVLFGLATYRAGMLPRAAAVMVAAGPASFFAIVTMGFQEWQPLVPFFVTGLGWAWLGYSARFAGEQVRERLGVEDEIGAEPAVR